MPLPKQTDRRVGPDPSGLHAALWCQPHKRPEKTSSSNSGVKAGRHWQWIWEHRRQSKSKSDTGSERCTWFHQWYKNTMTARDYDFNTGHWTTGLWVMHVLPFQPAPSRDPAPSRAAVYTRFCFVPGHMGQLHIIKRAVNQRQMKHHDKNPCTVRNSGWGTRSVNKTAGRWKVES